MIILTNLCFCR